MEILKPKVQHKEFKLTLCVVASSGGLGTDGYRDKKIKMKQSKELRKGDEKRGEGEGDGEGEEEREKREREILLQRKVKVRLSLLDLRMGCIPQNLGSYDQTSVEGRIILEFK